MRRQAWHTWWVISLLAMLPWLSFWTTPQLANRQGQTVVLCTLEGFKEATVYPQGLAWDGLHCPALHLLDALGQGGAWARPAVLLPDVYPLPFARLRPYVYSSQHFSVYSSRAPPPLS